MPFGVLTFVTGGAITQTAASFKFSKRPRDDRPLHSSAVHMPWFCLNAGMLQLQASRFSRPPELFLFHGRKASDWSCARSQDRSLTESRACAPQLGRCKHCHSHESTATMLSSSSNYIHTRQNFRLLTTPTLSPPSVAACFRVLRA